MDVQLPTSARPFSREEIEATVDLGPSAIVHLVFAEGVVPEHAAQVEEIVARTGARLILRPYEPAIVANWSPLVWGWEAAGRIAPYLGFSPSVVLSNEDNLPEEGGVTDPGLLADFWTASATAMRDVLGSGCPELLMPPLAPVGDYWDMYRALHRLGIGDVFERVAAHIYARTANWGDARDLAALFGAPVDVLEWDGWTEDGYLPADYCLGLMAGDQVGARCYFALSGDDPAFARYYLLPQLEERLRGDPELAILTERIKALESRIAAEETRNSYLVEALARYGLSDPEMAYHARRLAEACSPGIVVEIQAERPKR